jgi:hypothetical protein
MQRSIVVIPRVFGRPSVKGKCEQPGPGKGVRSMLKIEDFYALLTSGSEENALLAALRKLTEVTKVEEIVDPIGPNAPEWV